MTFASALVLFVELYLGFGLVFGLVFVCKGVERVDASAHAGTLGFRILILPGCAALWPWLVLRLIKPRRDGHA